MRFKLLVVEVMVTVGVMVVHTYDPSLLEAEARRWKSFRLAWAT